MCVCLCVCVWRKGGRGRWWWVQGSCSSLGHLQYGISGRGQSRWGLHYCGRAAADLPPSLIHAPSLKHGAILRDQNEAGTDSLVWTQQTDTKSVCELPAGCETHRKWTFSSSKADSCRGGVSIPTCIEWETHLMLDKDIVEDFKCFSSVYSHGTHKKHHNCF